MTTQRPGDHLEHLPSRSYLVSLAVISSVATVGAVSQLVSATKTGDSVLWSVAIGLGVVALVALGVSWEERRAHVHALVRGALEGRDDLAGADPIAELLRMGALREVDYLRSRAHHATNTEPV